MKPVRMAVGSLLISCLLACASSGYADAPAQQHSNPLRIIAIGDVHGDFKQFSRLLTAIGLIDKKRNWVGQSTHLVQLGDIPDRGPDSRKVMDLLMRLQKQSTEQGGAVTVLIGNHEAMMMTGDLRFVHPGEYAAFKDRNSKKRRKAYYQQTIEHLKTTLPQNDWPNFDKAYRKAWEARFPLGYVEHRLAWAPTGTYGKWVLSRPAVAQIGDTVFVHGGISPNYAGMSIAEINTRVRTALAQGEQLPAGTIVDDENGPLWDRGWVRRLQNDDNSMMLNQVLAEFPARRMVVAHTPLTPIIVPRFGGKILMADVGLSEHYGNGFAALEIVGDKATMLVGDQRLALPDSDTQFDAYFDAAQTMIEQPEKVIRYRELIKSARMEAEAAAKQAADGVNP